jgi:hypothetical protein
MLLVYIVNPPWHKRVDNNTCLLKKNNKQLQKIEFLGQVNVLNISQGNMHYLQLSHREKIK